MPDTAYSQTPFLLKGALIYFGAPMIIPIPNIIFFQYNPETMTRTLHPWAPPQRVATVADDLTVSRAALENAERRSLSQPYDPRETFQLVLEMDATDALEHPEFHPVAFVSGIADRLAAIENLMYPPGDSLLGGLLGTVAASVSFTGADPALAAANLSRREVPIVLFFWGPGRIVPVRITSLSIEEQQYSPLLYPLRAKASIGIQVLDRDDLLTVSGDPASGAAVDIALACYLFTRGQKELLAQLNLANSVESVIGMLPL